MLSHRVKLIYSIIIPFFFRKLNSTFFTPILYKRLDKREIMNKKFCLNHWRKLRILKSFSLIFNDKFNLNFFKHFFQKILIFYHALRLRLIIRKVHPVYCLFSYAYYIYIYIYTWQYVYYVCHILLICYIYVYSLFLSIYCLLLHIYYIYLSSLYIYVMNIHACYI